METAIIHLSDIHIEEGFNYELYSSIVVESLNELHPERVSLCISGDLANSGSETEYNIVDSFIDSLKNKIVSKGIVFGKVVFVAGNHDIEYKVGEKRQRSILHNMTQQQYYDEIHSEIQKFKNFYSFAECFDLPGNEKVINKQLPFVSEIIDGIHFKYYLLNNALYTTYKDDNHDDSKGTIIIPKEITNSIKSEPDTANILVMHFPISYLEPDSLLRLKSRMKNLSYILTGHTHDKTDIAFINKESSCAVSVGYALQSKDNIALKNGFSVLLINTKDKTIKNHIFTINDEHAFEEDVISSSIRIPHLNNPLCRKSDFVEKLNIQEACDVPLEQTFVFPELSTKDDDMSSKNIKVSTFEELKNVTNKGVPVFVCGPSKCGKTSLLKMLHFEFDAVGIPLLFDWKPLSSIDNLEIIIKQELDQQYSDSYLWKVFNSLPNNQRIALIDNAVFGEDIKNKIDCLTEYFGIIILAVRDSSYDARKHLLSGLLTQKQIARPIVLNIRPMFFSKRKELISKCYNAFLNQKHRKPDQYGDKFFASVQNALDRFVGTDSNYPYFIEMTSSAFFDKKIIGGATSKRLYNEIYRAHITNLIEKVFNDDDVTTITLKVLPIIATEMFHRDNYSLSEAEVILLIENFKKNKKIPARIIGSSEIVSNLVCAKVFSRTENDCIAFASADFLAFFAAQHLAELLEKDPDSNFSEIDNSLNHCYLDVHVRFLLFLVFFSKGRVYEHVVVKAKEYCINHERTDVVEMEFAKRNKESSNIRPLTSKQKRLIESKRHKSESDSYDIKEEEYRKEVDSGVRKDVSEFEIDIMKGWGILTLISSLIPEFKIDLDPDEQNECVELLYTLPEIVTTIDNRLLNTYFEQIINQIIEQFEKNDIHPKKEFVEEMLIDLTRARMLSLFESAMTSAHTRLTEEDLRDKKYAKNGTGKLLRLMSMIFDSVPNETFERVAPEYFESFTNSPFARNCISLMVRYYVTWIVPQNELINKKKFLLVFFNEETVKNTLKSLTILQKK